MKNNIITGILSNVLISSFLLLLLISNTPLADAKSGQLELTYSLDDTQYFCGDSGQVSLTIKNIDSSHQLKIVRAGVHFDWQQSNYYYFDNNSGNPVMLASGQTTTVFKPSFSVPTCSTISDHSWNIHIEYQEGGLWWSDETASFTPKSDFKIVDYSISIFPTSATITQGSKATFTITITGQNGFSKSVSLSTIGEPPGASSSFSSQSISGSGTSTMTIEASSSTSTGSYSITITGVSEFSSTKTTMTSITVNSAGILGGGGGSIAGISTNLIVIISIILLVLIIGMVIGIVIVKRRKTIQMQPAYQTSSQQPFAQPYQPIPQQNSPPPPIMSAQSSQKATFCGRCGKPLSPENQFCPSCGAPRS